MTTETKTRAPAGSAKIRERKNGTWEWRYSYTDPATSKTAQKSVYGKTRKEVTEKMRKIIAGMEQGNHIVGSGMTVTKWLAVWETEYLHSAKPYTRKSYAGVIRNHIKPGLGNFKLKDLTSLQIQRFINNLKNQKNPDIPLNPKTVKNIHGILHKALQQAADNEYIRSNPSTNTTLPICPQVDVHPLEDEQVPAFLQAIREHEFELIYKVDLLTGLREGEILGLKWADIDFDKGMVKVQRQLQHHGGAHGGYAFELPKNNKTRTLIPAETAMTALKEQEEKQAKWQQQAGEAWDNADNLVFTNALGRHLNHDLVYRNVKRICEKIGAAELNFHSLRHTYAVMSLRAGDDYKTLQINMGHYSAAFTLDRYGFVTEGMKRESATRMETYINGVSCP